MEEKKKLKKKEELVRIIVESLYSLGFHNSAASVESESGIPLKSVQLTSIETLIKKPTNLEECVRLLSPILPESALFVVCSQWVSECGVSTLSKMCRSGLGTAGMMHRLALDLLLSSDSDSDSANNNNNNNNNNNKSSFSRGDLFRELEGLLPPPVTLPEGRLLSLVEMAVESQMESCLYHNSPHQHLSLFHDHRCPRHLFPTHTIQVLTDHQNEVWFVQFSNNGQYLASSSSDCTAIIWKVLKDCKMTMKHTLQSHQKPVSFVAWSPDDTMLLTCGNIEVLKLWDVETGACKYTFGNLGFSISSCAWFPDSKRFVCGSSDAEKGIHMWDCEGNELKAWRGSRMPKILDLAVTPDGENLISIFSDKDIRILNLATNGERVISEEHPITSLSVSKDSKFLLVNLNSQEIHMWDVSGKWDKPLKYRGHKQHKYVIRSCFGGLNSTFIASGSENSQVYIWNRRSPNPIEVLSGHKMTVNCVSWNPERPQMLASASDDHTIRIWGPSHSDCTRKQET